jgi:hypothetical protein
MSTENEVLDQRLKPSGPINDPAYPGPNGKMFIFKINLTPRLAQTNLPKAVCDQPQSQVGFASHITFNLPPS